jgi:hypothetical protein
MKPHEADALREGRYADITKLGAWEFAWVSPHSGSLILRRRKSEWDLEDLKILTFKTTGDRAHWHSVKTFLLWLSEAVPQGSRWGLASYKTLRRIRHEAAANDWDDVLPPRIARWASGELTRAAAKEECCDNFRAARVGNTAQMRRYRRQKARGCCGSSDWEAVGPDGNVYALGFNYGH